MYFYLLSFVNEYTSLWKLWNRMNVEMLDDIHYESYVLSYLLPVSLFFWYIHYLIQCAYEKGREFKIDMMHLKMLDILLLILIMCLVWSTYNKTASYFIFCCNLPIFLCLPIFVNTVYFYGRQCIKFSVILSLAV